MGSELPNGLLRSREFSQTERFKVVARGWPFMNGEEGGLYVPLVESLKIVARNRSKYLRRYLVRSPCAQSLGASIHIHWGS